MDIDLQKLSHILAIARTLSFSRAAQDLNITQPALSKSIAGVEQRFGIRIFDRDRSGVSVTPVGALVIEQAEALVAGARTLGHNLRLYGKGEAGRLAIGMGPLIAGIVLPELGRHFLAATPHLKLRTSIKGPATLIKELVDDAIELAVCATEHVAVPDTLVAAPVGEVTFDTFVRGGHPLAGRSALTTADLAAFPVARVGDVHLEGPARPGGAFICDSYPILQDVVLRSDCIWHTWSRFVADHVAAGRLVRLAVVDAPPVRSRLAIVRKRSRTASPAARRAAAFITEQLRPAAT